MRVRTPQLLGRTRLDGFQALRCTLRFFNRETIRVENEDERTRDSIPNQYARLQLAFERPSVHRAVPVNGIDRTKQVIYVNQLCTVWVPKWLVFDHVLDSWVLKTPEALAHDRA